jgi:hypothetical protein
MRQPAAVLIVPILALFIAGCVSQPGSMNAFAFDAEDCLQDNFEHYNGDSWLQVFNSLPEVIALPTLLLPRTPPAVAGSPETPSPPALHTLNSHH